jgi:hypothetical protein
LPVKKLLGPILLLLLILIVATFLTVRYFVHVNGAIAQDRGVAAAPAKPQPELIPSCSGDPSDPSAPPSTQDPGGPKQHSVTLSWNPSLPASSSPADVIRGYYVFRSLKSKAYAERDQISKFPLAGTRCLDATVAPKTTYYYVVKAVAQSGVQSVVSEEIKAVIPFP